MSLIDDDLSNVNFFFNNPEDVVNHMQKSISMNLAASFIRLSDGEAKIIAYPEHVSFDQVVFQMNIWFGELEVDHADIMIIRQALIGAILNADYIGMPTPERIAAKDVNGNYTNDALLCRNMWKTLLEVAGFEYFKRVMVVPATFHQWAQIEKRMPSLLFSTNSLGMISRTDKALFKLSEHLSLDNIWHIKVPGETWSRSNELISSHFPKKYSEILYKIHQSNLSSSLVLVGAGVLGKVYCSALKDSGAFAFDVGALIDGWTNSIPDVRKGMSTKSEKMTVEYLFDI
jgi:hypothetical protein